MPRVTWWWLMVTVIAFKCDKCCAASTWVHLRTIGSEGAGNGQFNAPFGVAFEGTGHIVVSDSVCMVAQNNFVLLLLPSFTSL